MCVSQLAHRVFLLPHIIGILVFQALARSAKKLRYGASIQAFFRFFSTKNAYFFIFFRFFTDFSLKTHLFEGAATVGSRRRHFLLAFWSNFMLKYQGGAGASLVPRTSGSNWSSKYYYLTLTSRKSTFYWR